MSSDIPISTQAQVVLIDDDPHLRQALSQTLDLAGLKVASLGDARDLAARLPADWQGWWSATSACLASTDWSCCNSYGHATASCR
ncbi:C4 dicarboxylate transport response regulator protein [Stutzerimonas stutzeri]|nr:C4 dicarboxylate transport response regulator protein [Stutzerimonas stutzeri]